MPLSSPPAAPQRGDRTTFAQRVDAFITWMIGFVTELNIFSANLNTLAAGGAYTLPYKIQGDSAAVGGATGGNFALVSAGTGLVIDTKDARGSWAGGIFASVSSSSSAVRGSVRMVKQNDPSIWAIYNLTGAYSQDPGGLYGYWGVTFVASEGVFNPGDDVIVAIDRAGDRGDTGTAARFPALWIRDEKPSGTSGSTSGHAVGAGNVRTLNTVRSNEISGALLSANRVTLPAGQYRLQGHVPATGVGAHQALLFNVTSNAPYVYGSSERTDGSFTTRSLFMCEFTLGAAVTFELRHYLGSTAGSLGSAASSGANEVYSELIFEKVA